MKTECKILTYDINEISLDEIQQKIKTYCNNKVFSFRKVQTISTAIKDEKYYITIIFEYGLNLSAIISFLIIISIALFIYIAYITRPI